MNKERYNQIIDEVFKKYGDSHWTSPENPNGPLLSDQLWSLKPMEHSKETFINECKTDKEFSERWGLKIEERELSLNERGELFRKTYPYNSVDDFAPGGMEVQSISHQLNTRYDRAKIPTKLITITYNNEKIEIYE
jgi:hypothetical protein